MHWQRQVLIQICKNACMSGPTGVKTCPSWLGYAQEFWSCRALIGWYFQNWQLHCRFELPLAFLKDDAILTFPAASTFEGNISFQNRVSTGQTVNCCVKILLFVLNSFHNNGEKVTWWKVWEKVIGSGQNLCFLSPAKGLFPWFEIRDETVRLIFYCSSIYVCFNSFVNAFSACSVNKMCLLQRKECGELLPLVVQEWADMKLEDAVG